MVGRRGLAHLFMVSLTFVLPLMAQQTAATGSVAVPAMISFTGTLSDGSQPLNGLFGVTFSLYREQSGGSPLWLETQNVRATNGHYTVMLGASSHGLPMEFFSSGQARWLGVQAQGQAEQPRVLLLSVPYALKAGDAQTIGGLPPSAFVLAAPSSISAGAPSNSSPEIPAVGGSGTTDFIPLWTNGTTLGNSVFFQSGTGSSAKVGLNLTNPLATLDVNGMTLIRGTLEPITTGIANASKGFNSHPLDLEASSFNSSTHKASMQHFEWQSEPTGNNTNNPGATLNLLFGQDSNTPAETGLKLSDKGIFTFASGQTFPGAGDITAVNAGTDLTGGGTSGSVTLNLDITKVPQLASANTFTANQTVNGTMTATSFSGDGTNVTNVNAAELSGFTWQAFAQLGADNLFTGSQTVQGTSLFGPMKIYSPAELTTVSPNSTLVGLGTVGFSGAQGSGLYGTDAIDSFGGNSDTDCCAGASAFFGVGGAGFDGGTGVFAQGGNGRAGGADAPGAYFRGGTGAQNAGDGVLALAGSGLAGNFFGNVDISENLNVAGSKNFKIDHPLDPANKYLVHSAVESSERMNIYSGNVRTDSSGIATVQLPNWFEAENGDFRYQLTVIGQFAQAIVSQKIENNRFTIATNAPNVEVSWQVSGVRQDAYAKAHPMVVEEQKDARLRGYYIHPELYGAPPEKQIEWARHPELMRQMKARPTTKVIAQSTTKH